MEYKKSYSQYVQELSKGLQLYTKLGGSLYVPTKQNPFYDRLRQAKRIAEAEGAENVSFESIYADCGIKFDRDFQVFKQFTDNLSQVADEEGFVDGIKASKATALQVKVRSYLNTHAQEAGISPGEYLVLMTDYRFKNMVIRGDYVGALQEELLATYPTGVVRGMKQHNPTLFNKVVHFMKYSPEPISYDEALEFFGLENGNSRQPTTKLSDQELQMQEEQILENLCEMFPDRQIKNLNIANRGAYSQIVRTARRHDQTPKQWLAQNGFDYSSAANVPRLSKISIDAKTHEQKLLGMREELLKDYNTDNADEVDMFHINFEIACKIGKTLYGEMHEQNLETSPAASEPPTDTTIRQNIPQNVVLPADTQQPCATEEPSTTLEK